VTQFNSGRIRVAVIVIANQTTIAGLPHRLGINL